MSSPHWDENRTQTYGRFEYQFDEKALAGKMVVVAGGTGGLGAATTVLLAREGAQLIVGYRKDRERATKLSKLIADKYDANVTLIEGDIASAEVRKRYAEACATDAPFVGAAIFPGDPGLMISSCALGASPSGSSRLITGRNVPSVKPARRAE